MAPNSGSSRERVIEHETEADGGAEPRAVAVDRQEDLHGPDELRQVLEQPGALAERLADEPYVQSLQITQPAVDELGSGRGCLCPTEVPLEQRHVITLARQLPRHP